MAIAPIDLQVLYSQLENVSKNVVHQQQGLQVSNAIHQETFAKQLIEKNATVNKINDSENENIQNVDDRKYSQHNKNNFQKKENQKDELEKDIENKEIEFTDPNLGKFIDISG